MKQETENRQQRPQMICLCATCANAFYNVPTIRIQRVDRYQLVKDTCTYCGVRNGYDYIIAPRKSTRHHLGNESCKQKSIAKKKKVPQNLRDRKRV